MVHFCCLPGCSSNSSRDCDLSFFRLPLKKKALLKQWVHAIGRKNLPINQHTRVCSKHFIKACKRLLRSDEVPSQNIPKISKPSTSRKPPKERSFCTSPALVESSSEVSTVSNDVEVQTDDIEENCAKIQELKEEINKLKLSTNESKFSLSSVSSTPSQLSFYTGFSSYEALKACYNFLGPAVNHLIYDSSKEDIELGGRRCKARCLCPEDEFFLVLVRLRLGLMEKDLAYRFKISQSTVSRIIVTWINFLYLKFKEIPLWPPKELVACNMPKQFKKLYPTTRVIIDATEIFIEQPRLPEIQQMTFSKYKNHNTFKALIGISPSGAVTFVSKLFSGSISDKELTRKSGLLDLLDAGDSVMADRGFDIEDDLILQGVHLNIPPFMRGKAQLDEDELVTTRRIASLRIHVERAMERIKNFHIFDRTLPSSLTEIANRLFFVCCVLTNFNPPLC